MLENLKRQFAVMPWPIRLAAGGVVVLLLAVFFSTITNSIQRRKYETQKQGLEEAARKAMEEAESWMGSAAKANAKAEALEGELAKISQQLLDANAELKDAHAASFLTRKVYVEKKTPVSIPVYLTGNPSVDSIELCARLRASGFACQ